MVEMLKARRESLQQRGVKGFTLMEMLIVIAIIAVLVAIAIPVLSAQLGRANAATDEANIRDGYAAFQVQQLEGSLGDTTYILQKDGSVATTADNAYVCKGDSTALDASGNVDIGGVSASWNTGDKITYKMSGNTVTIEKQGSSSGGGGN